MNTFNEQASREFTEQVDTRLFNEQAILASMAPNFKEMRKETFKAVIAAGGIDPNGFMLGAVQAGFTGLVSLGVGALLGVNAGGSNNIIGLTVATVAGGVATKMIDDPYDSLRIAFGAGVIGTHLAAHGSKYLRESFAGGSHELNLADLETAAVC